MSSSVKINPNKTREQLENELTTTEKDFAKTLNLDPTEAYKATEGDYSNLTKYTFKNTQCPITDFKLTTPELTKPTKEQLAKQYYKFVESTPKINESLFSLSLPEKTNQDLIKPTNVKVKFNGTDSTPQFDYITMFNTPLSNWKILNHITNAVSHFNFIDSSDPTLPVYQSLATLQDAKLLSENPLDKPKNEADYFKSYGLYSIHSEINSPTVHKFKSNMNNFIFQTIDRKFNKSNKYNNQTEYYNLFNSIFIQDNKLKASLVSSLIIPNIINDFISDHDLFTHVPKATAGTYFNNFSSIDNVYNPSAMENVSYIPTYFTSTSISNSYPIDNLSPWSYPFISTSINSTGLLTTKSTNANTIIAENIAKISSNFIVSDAVQSYEIIFDDIHQFQINDKYKKTPFLKAPTTSTYSKKIDTIKVDKQSLTVEYSGHLTYNPNRWGAYCKGCSREHGTGIASRAPGHTDVYDLYHRDSTNKQLHYDHNIGRYGSDNIEYECAENSDIVASGKASAGDGPILNRYHFNYTCCKRQHNRSNNCVVRNLHSPNNIAVGITNDIKAWNIKFKNELNLNKSSINALNKSLASAQPISLSKVNVEYKYKFGNCLSTDEINKIKNSVVYAISTENLKAKLYSATFGELTSDTYIYDDRFFYIIYKYYTTNINMLCDVLESEILNYILRHPELLAIYRIQKGYLKYALNNLKALNPKEVLNVVKFDSQDEQTKKEIHAISNNVSCFMNIECPIIGAMIHSDTLNMVDYNDYISDSLTMFSNSNLKLNSEIELNDGKLVLIDLKKLPQTKINNIDSLYQNFVRAFGKISTNDLTIPGIFISDSGNPIDFIEGTNSSIQFVDVDGNRAQGTLNKIAEKEPGTLIVFSFDTLGMINRTAWSDNPKINEAIKNVGSEKIMNIEMPYVMLIKEIKDGKTEYLFEYSTFTSNDNSNGIKVLYYSQAEDIKDDGKTFLSHQSAKTNGCFRFIKNYCGLYQQTNPLGRLTTKLNVGDY